MNEGRSRKYTFVVNIKRISGTYKIKREGHIRDLSFSYLRQIHYVTFQITSISFIF